MMSLYSYSDYRAYLRQQITGTAAAESAWGGITRWTQFIDCQRSHGSRVLSGEKDLSPEQALSTAEFLELNEDQTEYFLCMVDLARAGSKALKERLQLKLKRLKKAQEDIARFQNAPSPVTVGVESYYYSAWYWSAIHILTSIPGFTTPSKIADKLQITVQMVQFCLTSLAEAGLVKKEGAHWKFASSSVHVPRTSPLTGAHHQNWRQQAVIDSQNIFSENLHFTTVQSISKQDFEKFKEQLLRLIESYFRLASPSEPEELVGFCFDFFKVNSQE